MNLALKDKVVVVTGGTRGIGKQMAMDFLSQGAKVIMVAREQPNDDSFTKLLSENIASLQLVLCDVTNAESMHDCFMQALAKWSRIDIVVANVGNGASTQQPVSDIAQWNKIWDINFTSAVNTARAFSEELSRNNGSLVFISSIAGIEFIGAPTDYSTAKNALIAFAKSLSHRLAPNARVNVVAPGNIWTEEGTWKNKMEKDPDAVTNMLNTKVPMKRFGTTEEVSNAVLFLSSSKASFITGACLVVDGGQTISF
jgi:3-oxoacyl-[acyl-carrier protein] reductase